MLKLKKLKNKKCQNNIFNGPFIVTKILSLIVHVLIKSNVKKLLTWKILADERGFSCNFAKNTWIKAPPFQTSTVDFVFVIAFWKMYFYRYCYFSLNFINATHAKMMKQKRSFTAHNLSKGGLLDLNFSDVTKCWIIILNNLQFKIFT